MWCESIVHKWWSKCNTHRPQSLQWCHNERHGISNHRHFDCLLNRLFRGKSKKTSKLHVTGLWICGTCFRRRFTDHVAHDRETCSSTFAKPAGRHCNCYSTATAGQGTGGQELSLLTQWGQDKMAAISQTTLSIAFSWMKMLEFRLNFHWRLFLRVQLTILQHWFR